MITLLSRESIFASSFDPLIRSTIHFSAASISMPCEQNTPNHHRQANGRHGKKVSESENENEIENAFLTCSPLRISSSVTKKHAHTQPLGVNREPRRRCMRPRIASNPIKSPDAAKHSGPVYPHKIPLLSSYVPSPRNTALTLW